MPVEWQAWFGGEAKSKVHARSEVNRVGTGDLRDLNRRFARFLNYFYVEAVKVQESSLVCRSGE